MKETNVYEHEVDAKEIADAMNIISKHCEASGMCFETAHVAMAMMLRLSGDAELYAFLAAKVRGGFNVQEVSTVEK